MNKKRIKKSLDLKKNWPGYVLLAPAVIAVFTLSIYPLFRGIYLSFVHYNLVRPNDAIFNTFAGLDNYKNIFSNKILLHNFKKAIYLQQNGYAYERSHPSYTTLIQIELVEKME